MHSFCGFHHGDGGDFFVFLIVLVLVVLLLKGNSNGKV